MLLGETLQASSLRYDTGQANGQALGYVYHGREIRAESTVHVLTMDEARHYPSEPMAMRVNKSENEAVTTETPSCVLINRDW
jgi:hypothetical protein